MHKQQTTFAVLSLGVTTSLFRLLKYSIQSIPASHRLSRWFVTG